MHETFTFTARNYGDPYWYGMRSELERFDGWAVMYVAGDLKPESRLFLGFFKAKPTVIGMNYSLRA